MYEEFKTSGIYRLHWPETGHFYIGQSRNIWNRFKQHRKEFSAVGYDHCNIKMQRVFDKHGLPKLEVVEYCSDDLLNQKEEFYLSLFWGNLKMCNLIAFIATNHFIKHTDDAKRHIATLKFGKRLSLSHRKAITNGLKRAYKEGRESHFGINSTGEKNPFYNKKHSPEKLEYWSKIRTGAYSGEENHKSILVLNIQTGIYYSSITDAAKTIGWPLGKLYKHLTIPYRNKTAFVII